YNFLSLNFDKQKKLLINKNPIENSIKFRFPKNLDIIMGQTEEGSKTTELVEKVLEWRKNQKNDLFWGKIFDCVKIIFQNFQKNPNFANTTNEIKSAFLKMRSLYKKMGILSGVEIEPDSQTKLLDETDKIEGVIGSCVPGAGGYDAIVAIILNDVNTRKNVEKLWTSNNIKILKVGIEKSEGISFDDIC
ncbi:phosphomevalonate kinase, partial [Bonamia ostreae]